MLRRIKVVPLAAESLGVRSMCTYVETPDIRVLLDAGVSLCPNRYGLPPHPEEFAAIIESRRRIAEAVDKAEIVTISHYHYDHHTPSFEDWLVNWTETEDTARQIYQNKTVLAKNPREQINYSQRERGWLFTKTAGKHAKNVFNADRKTYCYGETKIEFSEPVFHGPENSGMGWVLMTTFSFQDEKFMFAPDVQGPMSNLPLQIISDKNPQLLMIGGPPSYLSPMKLSEDQLKEGLENLRQIVRTIKNVILDHHILRDAEWQTKTTQVLHEAHASGTKLQTAADYLRTDNLFLENSRKKLFEDHPPSAQFCKWMKKSNETKKNAKPPL